MMEILRIGTRTGEEFREITADVERVVSGRGFEDGVLFIYVPHTTAGIYINESADPSVADDIKAVAGKLAPEDFGYRHMEGNSPGHVKSVLFGNSTFVFVENGKLRLGTWQGIFFAEFDGPRSRNVWLKFMGA